jgi:hypothetical protein
MVPDKSDATEEIRVLRREASHAVATVGRTLVVLWQTETSAHAVAELATSLAQFAKEVGRLGLLQVIGDRAVVPDTAARTALATLLKANESRLVASAVVFEGAGFRASAIRSIVIGISMLSRPKYPHTVFASTTAGVAWLSRQLDESWRDSADGMQRAIDRLRQCDVP